MAGAGGILGVLLGAGAGLLIRRLYPSIPTAIPVWAVAADFLVSVTVGLFFGLWPAVKAARLEPVEALRYE